MRKVILDLVPFGRVEIQIRGQVVTHERGEQMLYTVAEVMHNPFVPLVKCEYVSQVRAFAEALLETARALENAQAGLKPGEPR